MLFRITDLQPQKKNEDRTNVYINDTFYKGVSNYVVKKFKLEIGKTVDIETLKKAVYEDDLEKAKVYIANYHTNKTEKVIRDKLKEKGYGEDVADGVIEFLLKYNYIDDKLFAKNLMNDSVRLKKQGKGMIKRKLMEKGVDKEIIAETLENINQEDEERAVNHLVEKKADHYWKKAKNEYEWKSKMYQFLMSRGFQGELIKNAIEKHLSGREM